MKIATLQLAPELGAVHGNIAAADERLSPVMPGEVDLLVLPELAFSGGFHFRGNSPSLHFVWVQMSRAVRALAKSGKHAWRVERQRCVRQQIQCWPLIAGLRTWDEIAPANHETQAF